MDAEAVRRHLALNQSNSAYVEVSIYHLKGITEALSKNFTEFDALGRELMAKTDAVCQRVLAPGDAVVAQWRNAVAEFEANAVSARSRAPLIKYPPEFDGIKRELGTLVEQPGQLERFCAKVCDQSSRLQEECASSLTVAFRLFGRLPELAQFMIDQAVSESPAVEQLLVQDSFYKRGALACVRSMLTQGYLQESLNAVLSEVCVFDLMLDPSRAEPGQEHVVADRLYRTSQTVVDSVIKLGSKFPLDAGVALVHLKVAAKEKFGATAHAFPLVERYLLVALIGTVTNPYPLIVDRAPAPNSHRTLISVAKVLQATGNQMDRSDSFSIIVRSFLLSNTDRATEFLRRLWPQSLSSPRGHRSPGFDQEKKPSAMMAKDWATLQRLCQQVESFPPNVSPDALTTLLTAPGGTALRALCASIVKKDDVLAIIPCLFNLFRSQGLTELLVTWAINEHVAAQSESEPNFFGVRGKRTIPLMLVDYFLDREGAAYIRLSVRDLLIKLLEDPKVDRFDVNVTDRNAAITATKALLGICQALFDRFVSTAESVDPTIMSSCHKAVQAVQLKHRGKELQVLASIMFGSLLSRALQYPRRFGVVTSDPSPEHVRVLSNIRLAFLYLIDTYSVIGPGDVSSLLLNKFILANIPRVAGFTESCVVRPSPTALASRAEVTLAEAQDACDAIQSVQRPPPPSASAVSRSTSQQEISTPPSLKDSGDGSKSPRSQTLRGMKEKLFGKRGPSSQQQPLPATSSPSGSAIKSPGRDPNKKIEVPAELAALLEQQGKSPRGKTVTVEEAQKLRATGSDAAQSAEKTVIPGAKTSPPREKPLPSPREFENTMDEPDKPVQAAALTLNPVALTTSPRQAITSVPPESTAVEEMLEMQMSIPEFGLGVQEFVLPQWNVGDLVFAQWSEDGCWYKASIDERVDEDHYRVTFVEYGNSSVCDNATQIVELPDEQAEAVALASELAGIDATALLGSIGGQLGRNSGMDSVQKDLDSLDAKSLNSVVDEDGHPVARQSDADLLAALDKSLANPIATAVVPGSSSAGGPSTPKTSAKDRKAEARAREEAEMLAIQEALGQAAQVAKAKKEATESVRETLNEDTADDVSSQTVAVSKNETPDPAPQTAAAEEPEAISPRPALPPKPKSKVKPMPPLPTEAPIVAVAPPLPASPAATPSILDGDPDFESMERLPPLPDVVPEMSNRVQYKNYMRLKYEHQKRSEERPILSPVLSPVTSPRSDETKDGSSKASGKPKLKKTLSASSVKNLLSRVSGKESDRTPVTKKLSSGSASASGSVVEDEPVVRLERYSVLIDDELPELPDIPPPISNKAEYKQYMVLRYEYEKRGLLKADAGSTTSGATLAGQAVLASPSMERRTCPSCGTHGLGANGSCTNCDKLKSELDFDPSIPDETEEDEVVPVVAAAQRAESSKSHVERSETGKGKTGVVKSAEADLRYKPGDEVEAKWTQDGMWYLAQVTTIDRESAGGPFFLVVFQEYGNDQVCDQKMIRSLQTGPTFRIGDLCEAKWVEDEQFYPCKILEAGTLNESTFSYLVEFTEYGNQQQCTEDYLRPFESEICEVCEVYRRPGTKVCVRCGDGSEKAAGRLTTMLDDLDLGLDSLDDLVTPDHKPSPPMQRRLTEMLVGIDKEMDLLDQEAAQSNGREENEKKFAELMNEKVEAAPIEQPEKRPSKPAKKPEKETENVTLFVENDFEAGDGPGDGLATTAPAPAVQEPTGSLIENIVSGFGALLGRMSGAGPADPAVKSVDGAQQREPANVQVLATEKSPVEQVPEAASPSTAQAVEKVEQDEVKDAEEALSLKRKDELAQKKPEKIKSQSELEAPASSIKKLPSKPKKEDGEKPAVDSPPAAVRKDTASSEVALSALERAKMVKEKLERKRREEEDQKLQEEVARKDRLKKREDQKSGVESNPTTRAKSGSTAGAPPAAASPDSPSLSASSTTLDKSRSRANEILLRAKALAARAKVQSDAQGDDTGTSANESASAAVVTTGDTSVSPSSQTEDQADESFDAGVARVSRSSTSSGKRSSIILEQARAARAIALGGSSSGRGRGSPAGTSSAEASPASSTRKVAGTDAGVSGSTEKIVSPAVAKALERARRRLSVAKSLPAAGRGEGKAKVEDAPKQLAGRSSPRPSASSQKHEDKEQGEGTDASDGEAELPVPPPVHTDSDEDKEEEKDGGQGVDDDGAQSSQKAPQFISGSAAARARPRPPPGAAAKRASERPRPPPGAAKGGGVVARGSERPRPPPAKAAATVTCPSCQSEQSADDVFCDDCGFQVRSNE